MTHTLERGEWHSSLSAKRTGGVQRAIRLRRGASKSHDGTWAQVEQVIDEEAKTKRKRVVLADGTEKKNYVGPIDQGSGNPPGWLGGAP